VHPEQPQQDRRHTARDIAQQYSSATFSLRFILARKNSTPI
jgi:hypothetical protein